MKETKMNARIKIARRRRRTEKRKTILAIALAITVVLLLNLWAFNAWEAEQNYNLTHTERYGSINE